MHTALLIIDMQEGFRYPLTEKIIPNVKKLVNHFGKDAIFLVFNNKKGSWFEKRLKWKKFQHANERKILHELPKKHVKMEHTTYDILTPALLRYFLRKKVDKVLLCGAYTDVSVQMAALRLFDLEMPVEIVVDACASQHSPSLHASTIKSLGYSLGKKSRVKTAEVLQRYFPSNKGPNATSKTKRIK